MKLPAFRRLARVALLVVCLTGPGVARTRAVRHAPAAARAGSAGLWAAYWRRALPVWSGVYGLTLLGVLAAGLYVNRVEAAAPPSQGSQHRETLTRHVP